MALGGTIRGKTTALRLPVDADLDAYNRWMADMRVRRAHRVWHEPAMPATWKDRFKEIAKEKNSSVVFCFGHAPQLDDLVAAAIGAKHHVTALKKAGVAAIELKRLTPPSGQLLWLATPKLLRK